MTTCRNCGAELHGRFCHACGQKVVSPEIRVHDLVHEGIEEFAHVDGKIVTTLKLLVTKPGSLTSEFLEGRRARYISPIRLYLTCSLLFFALSALAPANPNEQFRITRTDDSSGGIDDPERDQKRIERLRDAYHDMRERVTHYAPRSMFVLMPVFGVFTWALYRRAQRYYVPHLYYAVHFHAFVFLVLAIGQVFLFAGRIGESIGTLLGLTIVPYHYLALRRVFGGSRWETTWKGTLIGGAYILIIAAIFLAILILTIRRALA